MKTRVFVAGGLNLAGLILAQFSCALNSNGLFEGTAGSGGTGGAGGVCGECPDGATSSSSDAASSGSCGCGGSGGGGMGGAGSGGDGGQGGSTSSTGGSTGSTGGGGSGGNGGGGNGGAGGQGPTCGNSIQEAQEICDGADLVNQTCGTVPGGYTSGTLTCLADCSAFNLSACVSPPPTCQSGAAGTVDNITASGAIETGLYLRYADGTSYYSTAVPTVHSFTGENLPGQMVLYGREGIQFSLKNGAAQVSKPFYQIDLSTLPSPECDGVALKSQACLAAVAKSFRCQHVPYNEAFNCPAPVTFTSLGVDDFYQDLAAGHHLLLVNFTCP